MTTTLTDTAGVRPIQAIGHAGPLELAGSSAAVQRALERLREAARQAGHVVVMTPDGIDAAGVAREIHRLGPMADGPFVTVDCGGRTPALLDEQLFGRRGRRGMRVPLLEQVTSSSAFAAARGGTLFLQEVGELPSSIQERLARVLRDGEVQVSGNGARPVAIAERVIAASRPGLERDVAEGRFRPDLFRRLSAIRLDLPALADRPEDIPVLVAELLLEVTPDPGARPLTDAALGLLAALPWPGNLAELRDVVRRLAGLPAGPIKVEDVLAQIRVTGPARAPELGSLREARRRFEREYVAAVLMHHGWRMSEAARTLGIQRTNLYRKARQLGIPCQRRAE